MLNLADQEANAAWRWDLAVDTHINKIPVYRVDKLTQEAITYLDLCDRDIRIAKEKMPLMAFAHDLYISRKKCRSMYEAALLARQSIDQVTNEYVLRKGQLKMYTSIFFDVIPNLNSEGWIYAAVFQELLARTRVLEFNQEEFWKYLAYNTTYSDLWDYYKLEAMTDATNNKFMRIIRGETIKKAMINIANIRPNSHMATQMLPLFAQELNSELDSASSIDVQIISEIMSQCQVSPQLRGAVLPAIEYPGQHADIKRETMKALECSE